MKKKPIFTVTLVAAMAAVSTVIYILLPEIPLVPGVDYLKLDFSDIPALLTGICAGPGVGILVEVVKNIIHLFRTTTYGIGELMNIGIGAVLVGSLYGFCNLFGKLFHNKSFSAKVYYMASVFSVICTVLFGWIFNATLTPLYFGITGVPITAASVWAGVTGSTLLNAVKAAFNLLPFYPVYFAAQRAFCKISYSQIQKK